MKKIAILYICTGKYDIFWKEFYKSSEKYLLPNCEKTYFVFTDAEKIYDEEKNKRIHKIYQENLGWPDNTLKRFHMFWSIKKDLEKYDYIYFFNANCEIKRTITEQEFLPDPKKLLVVKHIGYHHKYNLFYPYERRKNSTAYIKRGYGNTYIFGGFNGGGVRII